MKKYLLWSLLALGLALAACAAPEVKTKAAAYDRLCTQQSDICVVLVDVDSCTPGGVRADVKTLAVVSGNSDVDIFWILRTDGYQFEKKDGVAFKQNAKIAGEFDEPRGGHEIYRWRDRNPHQATNARPFDYTITIQKSDGSACGSLDPTIINDL